MADEKTLFTPKEKTYTQPSVAGQSAYAGIAVAVSVVVSWAVGVSGYPMPLEVVAALGTIIGWVSGKFGT
ncbi:MAG: hypothetical protein KUG67_00475 [Proteobacteria bacterium]|nr:hypothetical protein [Pseudomonadota bacterium]